MLWREVLVPAHVVGSDGLTAEVGGEVEMPLALDCRYRACAGPGASASVTTGPGVSPRHRACHDLVGRVVEVDRCGWPDGWMLDVDGLGIYVGEVGAAALPEPGSWVRVRGELSVAEAYETELFEPTDLLLSRAVRRWRVRRIVRVPGGVSGPVLRGHGQEVAVMSFDDDLRRGGGRTAADYLLDLEEPPRS